MSNVFKAAIVGCGNIYPMHANAIKKLPNVELVAVCDVKEDRARLASETYGCSYYVSYQEMFDQEAIDVVHICLPHYLHEVVTVEAAERGIHILTEKPMSTTVASAKRMIEVTKAKQVAFGVIFQNRYNIGSATLKQLAASGELGKLQAGKLQVTWSRDDDYYSLSDWKGTWEKEGGGVIIDQAIHTIDLVNWVIDGTPDFVDATIQSRFHTKIEVEDFAEGVIHYKEGYHISFMANNYYSYDAPVEIELHFEKAIVKVIGARVEINFLDGRAKIIQDIPAEDYVENGLASKTYWGTGHITQLKEFYQSLVAPQPLIVSGESALKTQILVEGIYQSGKLNKRYKF